MKWQVRMSAIVAAAVVGLCLGTVHAQNTGTYRPLYGWTDMTDETSQTVPVWIRAGGTVNAYGLGPGCVGRIGWQPDLVVRFERHLFANNVLRFDVFSPVDTTLVVRDIAGNWHCDDDGGVYRNPRVDVFPSGKGNIAVWVGLLDPAGGAPYGETNPMTQLFISNGFTWNQIPEALDPHRRPQVQVSRSAGFSADPARIETYSGGGNVDVRQTMPGLDCPGYASEAPSMVLNWQNPRGTSTLYFFSPVPGYELSLIILDPRGVWHCAQAALPNEVPSTGIRNPPTGRYYVWLATLGPRGPGQDSIMITELPQSVRQWPRWP